MTVSFRRRFLWAILVPFQLVITGCFRDGPTEPPLGDVVLSLVSGDEQFGPASPFLIDALTVVVRREESGQPVSEVVVDWEVTEGAGAEVEERTVASDSTGLASVRLKLGGTLGRHQVRAWLRERPEESVEFLAWAVLPPELSQLSVTGAMAGDVITLEGENFSAIPDHNVVLFSGIRGAVTGARVTQLEVVVPPDLPLVMIAFPLGPWTYPFGLGESPALPSSWPWRPPPRSSTWLRAVTRPSSSRTRRRVYDWARLAHRGTWPWYSLPATSARPDSTIPSPASERAEFSRPPGGPCRRYGCARGPFWELGCLTPCSSRLGLVRARSGTTSSPSLAREIWRCRSARGERTYRW